MNEFAIVVFLVGFLAGMTFLWMVRKEDDDESD